MTSFAQFIPFGFWQQQDPCSGTPPLATVCKGGALYAGSFGGNKLMITPSGCTNSATPTCAGGTDTVIKKWNGDGGSNVDVPGVENVGADSGLSTVDGSILSPIIEAHSSVAPNSAAEYCNDMTFGGYSDWYLPSKSELVYIYCKSSVPSHNTSLPQEDPNCVSNGGKTSNFTGFANSGYWVATESNIASRGWRVFFTNGDIDSTFKFQVNIYVRCMRRY